MKNILNEIADGYLFNKYFHIKKLVSIILIIILAIPFGFWPTKQAEAADQTITLTSQNDFKAGTIEDGLDADQSAGDLRLKYKTITSTDTTDSDFYLGKTLTDGFFMSNVSSADGGKVTINQGYTYQSNSSPALSNYPYASFLDASSSLLYVSTWGGGLSVIDTKGTVSPSDDTLLKSYTTATTPAIANNKVMYTILDASSSLLYVSTNGGLSVIDTKGTKDPADDTLVITYTTTSTPAINDNIVNHSFLDASSSLLYVSTGEGGVSVIDTKGTKDPTDDTLVRTYTTTSTPAIGSGNVYHSFLDASSSYLYISVYGSGLSVIDTKGTKDPLDDTLVKTYTKASSPAIGSNNVEHSFLDASSSLLYVSTWGGGLSVIDTKGTKSAADDTLVRSYTTTSTPGISDDNTYSTYLDATSSLLYVSNYGGLSVVSLNNLYNTRGVYNKTVSDDKTNFWQTKTEMPSAVLAAGSAVIGDTIYVIGGMDSDSSPVNTVYAYDTKTNTWTTKAPLPAERSNVLVGVIGGKLYVAGGKNSDGDATKTVYEYNPTSNAWATKTSMSQDRIGPVGGVYNGKLYVGGGMNSSCGVSASSIEEYNPDLNTWTTKTPAPSKKLGSATAQFINGKLYVAGGQSCSPLSDSLLIYDVATDSWTTGAPLPFHRVGGTSAVHDGKLLYIGGSDGVNVHSDMYIYDPVTDIWNFFNNLPQARHRAIAEIVNGDLYVIGGALDVYGEITNITYKLPSTYLSDTYQKNAYSQLSWAATTPSGTSVELLYSFDDGKTYTSLGTTPGDFYLPPNRSYDLTYKAILSTDNTSVTPSLDSVTVKYAQGENGLYATSSAAFTSAIVDFGSGRDTGRFIADATTTASTSIAYSFRSGSTATPDGTWTGWQVITDTLPAYSRYGQVKATLSTTDLSLTPTLSTSTNNNRPGAWPCRCP